MIPLDTGKFVVRLDIGDHEPRRIGTFDTEGEAIAYVRRVTRAVVEDWFARVDRLIKP